MPENTTKPGESQKPQADKGKGADNSPTIEELNAQLADLRAKNAEQANRIAELTKPAEGPDADALRAEIDKLSEQLESEAVQVNKAKRTDLKKLRNKKRAQLHAIEG